MNKIAERNTRVSASLAHIPYHVHLHTLERRVGSTNENADFHYRLLFPKIERDCPTSDEERVFLVCSRRVHLGGPSVVRVGLRSLANFDSRSGLGGLPAPPTRDPPFSPTRVSKEG